MKTLSIVKFQLLLLQLEEYELRRFIKAIQKTGGMPPAHPIRKPLVWTTKIKLIYALSILILLMTLFGVNNLNVLPAFKLTAYLVLAVVHFYYHFIFITLAVLLLYPVDLCVKEATIYIAKNKIRKHPDLKIIGIAGSYGKTGMKEFIATVLEQKFNVLKTAGSVNTPYAIANLILKKLTRDTEIFVVEMGEYYRGDIKKLCDIARPDIAVVTGINEAHLERMKTIGNTVSTIFEIVENMKPGGLAVLNDRDKLVKVNYDKYAKNREIYLYSNKNRAVFDENIPGYIIYIYKSKIFFPLLGSFNLDKIDGAAFIGKKLGLINSEIINGIKNIKPQPHRLQPLVNTALKSLIIDDSYNGNPDGVEAAIKTLGLFGKRRKIFITPGLVEMGEKSREIHYNIGVSLAGTADLVVLIRNSVTPDIERGLLEKKFSRKNIVWFESADEAYGNIKNIINSDSVVLLQNDWPDNYI